MSPSRSALINRLREQLGGLYDLSEKPTSLEEYAEELETLETMAQVAGELAAESWELLKERQYYAKDFARDLAEKATREDELYGMPSHRLDGRPR